MLVSELIKELTALQQQHGDVQVLVHDAEYDDHYDPGVMCITKEKDILWILRMRQEEPVYPVSPIVVIGYGLLDNVAKEKK